MTSLIGIFGGTFDPVHYGHLKPALDVKNALALDEVRFIPNQDPPHRESPWLKVEQRIQLLELAVLEYPGFMVDDRELKRQGKSYMVDTLQSLRTDFPRVNLCLILGMDAIAGLRQWHQWDKILTLCHIVVTTRPGYQWDEIADSQWLEPFITDDMACLKREAAGRILLQSVIQVDISASEIRQSIKKGQDISNLVPPKVHQQLMKMTQNEFIEAVNDD